jgi:hypothetical protein
MKKWHGPTDEGWVMICVFTVLGAVAGGWFGAAIMLGFFVFVSVVGYFL